ncbi:hypothetical protein E4U17_003752, partial [Claviceps sp. LM77 group G4]
HLRSKNIPKKILPARGHVTYIYDLPTEQPDLKGSHQTLSLNLGPYDPRLKFSTRTLGSQKEPRTGPDTEDLQCAPITGIVPATHLISLEGRHRVTETPTHRLTEDSGVWTLTWKMSYHDSPTLDPPTILRRLSWMNDDNVVQCHEIYKVARPRLSHEQRHDTEHEQKNKLVALE